MTIAWNEELGSERVTEREPEKGQPGALKAIREHLPFIFAERPAPDQAEPWPPGLRTDRDGSAALISLSCEAIAAFSSDQLSRAIDPPTRSYRADQGGSAVAGRAVEAIAGHTSLAPKFVSRRGEQMAP